MLGLTGPVLAPVLRLRLVDRLKVLAHPAVALPLWAANLYLWHLAPLYQGTLDSGLLHALMHGGFIVSAVLVWMPLFGPLPKPEWFGNLAKLLYIVVLRFAGAILANVFIWSETVFYPDYAPGRSFWGIDALADQGTAGALMMVEESLLTIALFGWLFVLALRQAEERQDLLELAAERGVQLSETRARRAVAAGRGGELRERIASGHSTGGALG